MKRSFGTARDGGWRSGVDESSGKASDRMLWCVTCLVNVKLGSGEERRENERGEVETTGEKGKQKCREERAKNGRRMDTSTERFKGDREIIESRTFSRWRLAGDSSLRRFLAFYANYEISCARLSA
jgi:hypothetical protein